MRKLIVACILISGFSFGQNFGYLGKKNLVDFKVVARTPFTAWMVQQFLFYNPQKFGLLSSGFYVNYTHIMKRNAFALEAGVDFFHARDDSYYTDVHNTIRCWNFMPKYVFANRVQFLPIGITHQLGIGYFLASNTSKSSYFGGIYNPAIYQSASGISFLYELTLRTAITKRLMMGYSMRFTANAVLNQNIQDAIEGPFAQKELNFISGSIGFSYAF